MILGVIIFSPAPSPHDFGWYLIYGDGHILMEITPAEQDLNSGRFKNRDENFFSEYVVTINNAEEVGTELFNWLKNISVWNITDENDSLNIHFKRKSTAVKCKMLWG